MYFLEWKQWQMKWMIIERRHLMLVKSWATVIQHRWYFKNSNDASKNNLKLQSNLQDSSRPNCVRKVGLYNWRGPKLHCCSISQQTTFQLIRPHYKQTRPRCWTHNESNHWWLVRVTLVVDWLFLPHNFGPMVGTYKGLLVLCEWTLGEDCTSRWWGHISTICHHQSFSTTGAGGLRT